MKKHNENEKNRSNVYDEAINKELSQLEDFDKALKQLKKKILLDNHHRKDKTENQK